MQLFQNNRRSIIYKCKNQRSVCPTIDDGPSNEQTVEKCLENSTRPDAKGVFELRKSKAFFITLENSSQFYKSIRPLSPSSSTTLCSPKQAIRKNGSSVVLETDDELIGSFETRVPFNRSNTLRNWPKCPRKHFKKSFSMSSFFEDSEEECIPNSVDGDSKISQPKFKIGCFASAEPIQKWRPSCLVKGFGFSLTSSTNKPIHMVEGAFSCLATNKEFKDAALSFTKRNYMPEVALFLCAVIDYKRICGQKSPLRTQYNTFLQLINQFIELGSKHEINISENAQRHTEHENRECCLRKFPSIRTKNPAFRQSLFGNRKYVLVQLTF